MQKFLPLSLNKYGPLIIQNINAEDLISEDNFKDSSNLQDFNLISCKDEDIKEVLSLLPELKLFYLWILFSNNTKKIFSNGILCTKLFVLNKSLELNRTYRLIQNLDKDCVRLCWLGCRPPSIHRRCPTTAPCGSFCLLRLRPGPVRSALDDLVGPGSRSNPIDTVLSADA
ncbi:hypothetical protein CEXT_700901 [Caerostris extrusa]|uniref:Uncharacterized protein n=1 Tax=Caerostris extrusa TaxID=172846 RepID=A0AAV4R053_CAEEX|nr:hypothetical protein CEXT_700901 [Caerostris extrusa]